MQALGAEMCLAYTTVHTLLSSRLTRLQETAFVPGMAGTFHGSIDAHIAVPAPQCGPGGMMNFNFGPTSREEQERKRKPFSTVPFAPDPDYVDRSDILAWVRDKCSWPGARAALVGLGGVGKSQLAIQYAHSVREVAPQTFVFWVHASTTIRFEEAYLDMASRLDLPERDAPGIDVFQLVHDWLRDEENGKWVMVLDNVDDVETFSLPRQRHNDERAPKSLAAYIPQSCNGSILITSRSKDAATKLAGDYNKIKEVLAMGESEGLELLRKKLEDTSNEEGAVELVRMLGCMPLLITQAAAYINRRARMTITGYLEEFANSEKRKNLLIWDAGDLRRDESVSNSVVITWQMSFERIQRERPSAAELLSLMSFFNPQGIPESVLQRYSESVARTSDEDEADCTFDEDVDLLQAYSLVTATMETTACEMPPIVQFKMHPLVQFCTQMWLASTSHVDRWHQGFIELMAREFPNGSYETWAQCQQLLPHVEPLYGSNQNPDRETEPWTRLLTKVAWYMMEKGRYKTAQNLLFKVLRVREKALGRNHVETLDSVIGLARALQLQTKYSEAEQLNRRALKGHEKSLGILHPKTLQSLMILASTLDFQGKYSEAETLHREALEGFQKTLGDRHVTTLTSIHYLAMALTLSGKSSEAESLYKWAIEALEKEVGPRHPNTLFCVGDFATLLHNQKRYKAATEQYQRVCDGLERTVGPQHPATLDYRARFSKMQQEAEDDRISLDEEVSEEGSTHNYTLPTNNLNSLSFTSSKEVQDAKHNKGSQDKEESSHDNTSLTNGLSNLSITSSTVARKVKYRKRSLFDRLKAQVFREKLIKRRPPRNGWV